MRPLSPFTGFVLAIGLAILIASWVANPVRAAERKPNPAAAANARAVVESLKKQADTASARFVTATGKVKEAGAVVVAALKAAAEANQKLATAYESGDAEDIAATSAAAAKAGDAARRAQDRATALESQASYASTANDEGWRNNTGEAQMPLLNALLDARRDAAAAYGKLADALAGDKTQAVVEDLRDQTIAAFNRVGASTRALDFAKDIAAKTAQAKRMGNTAITTKIEELNKLYDETIATLKQQSDLQVKLRVLDRRRAEVAAEYVEMTKRH